MGFVRPEGTVTYRGADMTLDGPSDSPEFPAEQGWITWSPPPEPPEPLEQWWQSLRFKASFPDGTRINSSVDMKCDPSLTAIPGFVTGMSTDDGITYDLAFQGGAVSTRPDGWSLSEEGGVDTFPVPADEVFVEFDHVPHVTVFVVFDHRGRQLYRASEMAALLDEYGGGMCVGCTDSDGECPDRCLVSTMYGAGTPPQYLANPPDSPYLPFQLLIDADGLVLQATQLDPTILSP